MPTEIPTSERFRYLSAEFSGDILAVVNNRIYRHAQLDAFCLRGVYLPAPVKRATLWRDFAYVIFAIVFCLRRKYDVIVGDPIVTGPLALILAQLTSAKVLIEVSGNFEAAFKWNSKRRTLLEYLKHEYCRFIIPYVLKRADGVKFVYPGQRLSLQAGTVSKIFVFPNFVPISHFRCDHSPSKYILFLGYPWFLKGVDILIRAFNRISNDFPDYTLKIVGYCPDKTEFVKLTEDNPRIELCDPVWYADAINLMSECALLVLPSRTDASPRVLREAMASKKPIVASNVDGIPSLITHGVTGLLFESENVDDLAEKMRMLLTDEVYAKQLAENGYRFVHAELSEERYVENFSKMIEAVCANDAI